MAERKLHTISDKELFDYEQKVREALLGQDEETRRLLLHIQREVHAEQRRRRNTTTESAK